MVKHCGHQLLEQLLCSVLNYRFQTPLGLANISGTLYYSPSENMHFHLPESVVWFGVWVSSAQVSLVGGIQKITPLIYTELYKPENSCAGWEESVL